MSKVNKDRLDFWDDRASLGVFAGTNDIILKKLEIKNIFNLLGSSENILDAGCGNGVTAIELLKLNSRIRISGFDYSPSMIHEAKNSLEESVKSRLKLQVGNLLSPPFEDEYFDLIYTERSLINLDNFEDQINVIQLLSDKLKLNGHMLLCESFLDGLDEINSFRQSINLDIIEKPWHNTYFRLNELKNNLPNNLVIVNVVNFSSSYYFLSRVVNAWFSKNIGEEPEYDAPLNKLAYKMPEIGSCAQTKILVLKKLKD